MKIEKTENVLLQESLGRYLLVADNCTWTDDGCVLVFLRKSDAVRFGYAIGLEQIEVMELEVMAWGILKSRYECRFVNSLGERIHYEEFDE